MTQSVISQSISHYFAEGSGLKELYEGLVIWTAMAIGEERQAVGSAYKERIQARHEQYYAERLAVDARCEEALKEATSAAHAVWTDMNRSIREASDVLAAEVKAGEERPRRIHALRMRTLVDTRTAIQEAWAEMQVAPDDERLQQMQQGEATIDSQFASFLQERGRAGGEAFYTQFHTATIAIEEANTKLEQFKVSQRSERRATLQAARGRRDQDIAGLRLECEAALKDLTARMEVHKQERQQWLQQYVTDMPAAQTAEDPADQGRPHMIFVRQLFAATRMHQANYRRILAENGLEDNS